MAESGEIRSPRAASPNALELTTISTAMNARARPSMVTCAPSFSSAIRRLPNGVTATRSRLPRLASPASVDDSAEDRPEGGGEDEHQAVLPGHVSAHGAESDRLAEEVDHLRRHPADELVDLQAGGRCREDARHCGSHDEREPAQQAGGDDERQARVTDRLAVDGAEAVDAADRRGAGQTRRGRGHDAFRAGDAAGALPSTWPYCARKVSSSVGSRLTKSSNSYSAAARTTGVIGPNTRMRRT